MRSLRVIGAADDPFGTPTERIGFDYDTFAQVDCANVSVGSCGVANQITSWGSLKSRF